MEKTEKKGKGKKVKWEISKIKILRWIIKKFMMIYFAMALVGLAYIFYGWQTFHIISVFALVVLLFIGLNNIFDWCFEND